MAGALKQRSAPNASTSWTAATESGKKDSRVKLLGPSFVGCGPVIFSTFVCGRVARQFHHDRGEEVGGPFSLPCVASGGRAIISRLELVAAQSRVLAT